MVVDDDEGVRNVLHDSLELVGYTCFEASNGEEALRVLEKEKLDVVITDVIMPVMDGVELTKRINQGSDADVIIMTGFTENITYDRAIEVGASDFIHKPVSVREMLVRLSRVLRERTVLSERNRAEEQLKRNLEKLRRSIDGVVQAMALAVEVRDPYTAGHQKRVADLACAVAEEMGFPSDKIMGIRMAGAIHDLGKISVPAEILSKPTKLIDLEMGLIKTHPQVGSDILKRIEFPWPLAQIVLQHHERMDGSGYPQGLRGDEILPEARLIAVADVVEAMASHRPYRPSRGIESALREIAKNKGKLYDPAAVDACLRLFREKRYHLE